MMYEQCVNVNFEFTYTQSTLKLHTVPDAFLSLKPPYH